MSDIYNIVNDDRDPIKKLIGKIPGFKGYLEQVDRRSSDKLLGKLSPKNTKPSTSEFHICKEI